MVSKAFFVFMAALCCASALRVRRQDGAADQIKEEIGKASDKVKEVGGQLSKMVGMGNNPLGEKLVNTIKEQMQSFVDQAEQLKGKLEEEVKQLSGAAAKALTNLTKKIGEIVSGLRQQLENAGGAEKVGELVGTLQEGVNGLLEETKKVVEKLGSQVTETVKQVPELVKNVLEQTVGKLGQPQ